MHLVRAVADNLQRLFYGAIRRSYAYRLIECGRRLSLQTGNLPSSLLKVRHGAVDVYQLLTRPS